MKVLLVSNLYPSPGDPTFGTFVQICHEGLEGMDVDLVAIRGRSRKIVHAWKYLVFFLQLSRQYLFNSHDVVYVHYILHPAPVLRVLRFLKPATPIVLNVHGGDVLPRNRLHSLLFRSARALSRQASSIVVPSAYYREVASKALDLPPERFHVWPSGGVDAKVFHPASAAAQRSGLRVGFVSRLEAAKGVRVLLDGISLAASSGLCLESIQIAGFGTPSELRQLQKDIAGAGLDGKVVYHGPLPHEQMAALLRELDVFVFPTLRLDESLGLVALEAMSCGIPVIGSNIAALPEYIVPGRNGDLFEPGSAEDLARSLVSFQALALEGRESMRHACLATASRYERAPVAAEIRRHLESCSTKA